MLPSPHMTGTLPAARCGQRCNAPVSRAFGGLDTAEQPTSRPTAATENGMAPTWMDGIGPSCIVTEPGEATLVLFHGMKSNA
jgi:hypothetical protein